MPKRVAGFLTCFILVILAGCKAELIETKIKTSDIKLAISKGITTVPFETKITIMGETEDTRQQIKSFGEIIEQYVELDDVEIEKSMMGMDLVIEGNIPLVHGKKLPRNRTDPWALFIKKNNVKGLSESYPYSITLLPTRNFGSFKNKFSELNILLTPSASQPVSFKMRNNDKSQFNVFSGGVMVNGEAHAIFTANVKRKLSLTMKDGVYDTAYPVVFFRLD
ncbi:MAG: hypothetical protein VX962_07635 [Pseudomonadota bacterium]|nr:hypothetical protein [Pseudomonadota bacterium]